MSKHLDNLERLCNKFQRRYGAQDALCLQVKADIEAKKAVQPPAHPVHDWTVSYRTLFGSRRSGPAHHPRRSFP